jgi:hypothetical protein
MKESAKCRSGCVFRPDPGGRSDDVRGRIPGHPGADSGLPGGLFRGIRGRIPRGAVAPVGRAWSSGIRCTNPISRARGDGCRMRGVSITPAAPSSCAARRALLLRRRRRDGERADVAGELARVEARPGGEPVLWGQLEVPILGPMRPSIGRRERRQDSLSSPRLRLSRRAVLPRLDSAKSLHPKPAHPGAKTAT